jgi:SagB-type dehydrogenase family enzyme
MDKRLIAEYRAFLKDTIRKQLDFSQTDQSLGRPIPRIEKPCPAGAARYDLPGPGGKGAPKYDLAEAIAGRRSRRAFTREALSLGEVAFLLWATQGVRGKVVDGHAFRTVPSAGCRHALETYVAALNVDGLEPALYRYLPLAHQLVFERKVEGLGTRLVAATLGQTFVGTAAAVFAWCALPYRMEWRYGLAAHKVIALDAGHVCQNLYLACEAIGAGTCAVAAYDQEAMDEVLGLDGEDEFTVYLAPVGKVKA